MQECILFNLNSFVITFGSIYSVFYLHLIDISTVIGYMSHIEFLKGTKILEVLLNNPTVLFYYFIILGISIYINIFIMSLYRTNQNRLNFFNSSTISKKN